MSNKKTIKKEILLDWIHHRMEEVDVQRMQAVQFRQLAYSFDLEGYLHALVEVEEFIQKQ